MGRVRDETSNYMSSINLSCAGEDCAVPDLWKLDVLGIRDPTEVISKQDRALEIKHNFDETANNLANGRYEVRLPWVEGHPPLTRNFEMAKRRLEVTFSKLKKMGLERAYGEIFGEWLREEIIEEVPPEEWDAGHYIPHRPVFKENSTTPIRPVFDASACEKGKPSLNQCLEKGVNLIELIPEMLLRFRLKEVGIIADIRKAFLQISLHEDDRDFLRFPWYDTERGKLKIFRHARVVFGVTSSPFLLGAVFDHHLSKCEKMVDQGNKDYAMYILKQLRHSLYVDNCVTSILKKEVPIFIKHTVKIFADACFEMRGWEYADETLIESTKTSVLGMIWDRKRDVITINFPKENYDLSVVTRRTVLSIAQRIFDPIGVTSPTVLLPKLLIQSTWVKGIQWDTPLDEESAIKFIEWVNDVQVIRNIELPRWVLGVPRQEASLTLHTFCNASQIAYAAVVYLRVATEGGVYLRLLAARTRVSPVKRVTIPRLELLAATIAARLHYNVKQEFKDIHSICRSASMTVLSWIKREEVWGVFVRNRVKEIQQLTDKGDWRHVPGTMNPADMASRGCSPKFLVASEWWEGPTWLKQSHERWPSDEDVVDEEQKFMRR